MSQLNRQLEEMHSYEFGPFRVDAANRLLLRSGEVVPLTSKVFDILLVFVQNSGRLLDKDEVMREVWPDSFVEEGNLTRNVSTLRKALGESPHEHQYIVTVPGRGYRFVPCVRESGSNGDALLVKERMRARIVTEEEIGAGDESVPPGLPDRASLMRSDELAARETNVSLAAQTVTTQAAHSPTHTGRLTGRLAQHRLVIVLGAAALIIAASVVAYLYVARGGKMTADQGAINSVAVMPFVNVGADPEMEYLSDGITESLINQLARLQNLKIKSRNSVFHYKGREVDAQAVGRELGVQAVLTGRIVQRGDALSISVELVDARDNSQLWGEQYERKLADVLAVQRAITQEITEKLRLPLAGADQNLVNKRYTENAEAYQLYLKGRYFWNKRTGAALQKAVEYFNQAVAKDPAYAQAYAGLADCYSLYSTYEVSSGNDSFPKAEEAAMKALALDDTLAEAHTSLAFVSYHYEWDWARAEREFKRAIELNPNYATAHHWYGEYLGVVGRFDEAVAEYRVALQLDPLSFVVNLDLGWDFYLARRYDDAIAQYRKALEFEPNSPIVHSILSQAYEQQGKYAEAADEYLKALQAEGFNTQQLTPLKAAFAASGHEGFLRAKLAWWRVRAQKYHVQPVDVAQNYASLHKKAEAFTWLQKAYAERSADMVFLKTSSAYDNLRDDSRFTDLLRRMNLAP